MPGTGLPGTTAGIEAYPLLPLRGMVVFPHMVTPLEVGRRRSVQALESAMVQNRRIVLVAQKAAQVDEPGADDLYGVGVIGEVKQLLRMPEGQIRILVEGLSRVRVVGIHQEEPFFVAAVTELSSDEPVDSETLALMRTASRQFERYVHFTKKLPAELLQNLHLIDEPGRLGDALAAQLPLEVGEKQRLLELVSVKERLEQICVILTREMEIAELERRIHVRVRKQMEKTQKEYYLREQMKAIQKELGERDERAAEIEELRQKMLQARLPKVAREKAEHELQRLERMPPMSAEAAVVRHYLDWLLSLPWRKQSKDRLDLKLAEQIVERDHYGLARVKERILEFLAVRQLASKLKGPILCLVGPPGVGKTSLARSVAEALDRQFVRISLGGVRDEAEIRGHRRTYVGAMPGKVLQAMRQAGTRNPVILLDEIDKMSADFRGDPAAALLEVLDPEQNSNFSDHYLEIPFDLSDVMFVTTANLLLAIPRPLRDRMEVIEIPGYTEEEKHRIAVRHLLPKQKEAHGLGPEQLTVSDNAIRKIIEGYTREAGVRELERNLAALCRKAARQIVEEPERQTVRVDARNLERFLGVPRYRHNRRELEDRVGLANGLAYTEVGGELMTIEVAVVKGRGALSLTGKLGEVMRESAQAGFSYLRSRAEELGLPADFHEHYDIHIHVPEGAVPKDGPSAGVTMAVALTSALRGQPVRSDVAMTGEITLRGRILPVGGIKEKVLAARRAGITTVILPLENEKDLLEIPEEIRRELEFVFVDHMDEVLDAVFVGGSAWRQQPDEAAQAMGEQQELPFVAQIQGDTPSWMEGNA